MLVREEENSRGQSPVSQRTREEKVKEKKIIIKPPTGRKKRRRRRKRQKQKQRQTYLLNMAWHGMALPTLWLLDTYMIVQVVVGKSISGLGTMETIHNSERGSGVELHLVVRWKVEPALRVPRSTAHSVTAELKGEKEKYHIYGVEEDEALAGTEPNLIR
ncbi:hypothetical protein VTL71DRAFT_7021 [Oculimacula yallundae]|uniref:Uncharacterized protein n=1 Tax=Oculimacula yallundae TaxID=86028 RepID=A0ABR4BVJ0_9HELO